MLPIYGFFNDPSTEQTDQPGHLIRDDNGDIRLELNHGGFNVYGPVPAFGQPELRVRSWPILTGRSRGGRPLTLLKCELVNTRGDIGDVPISQLITVGQLIEGEAMTAPDESAVIGAAAQIGALSPWLHSALQTQDLHEERPWPTTIIQLDDDVTVTLRRHTGVEFISTSRHTGRLEKDICDLLIGFPKAVQLRTALTMVDQLAQLVSVASLRVCRPLTVTILASTGSESILHSARVGQDEFMPPQPGDFLLPVTSIESVLPAWLGAWQSKGVSPLREAAYAAAEVIGRPDLSSGLRLNRAVSASELLYRHLETTVPIPPPIDPGEHQRIVNEALSVLDPADANYLNRRLRGNDRSMKMQLDEVIKRVPADAQAYLWPSGTTWSKSATSGRSSAAHGTVDDEHSPDAVLALLTAITVLVVVCEQLGVPRTADDLRQITAVRRARRWIWEFAANWR